MPYPEPISPDFLLEDGGTAVASNRSGRVGGVARIIDVGGAANELWEGFLIFDVSEINMSGTGEYGVTIQLSNTFNFTSGVVDFNAPAVQVSATGQQAVIITNQIVDTRYRYMRAYFYASGSPSRMMLRAWIIRKESLDHSSLSDLIGLMLVATERFTQASTQFRAWSSGAIDGGPNGDGDYPLSDGFGNTYLIPCPAKIAQSSSLSWSAINSLTARTTPYAPQEAGPVIPFNEGNAVRKGSLFLFASRRTQDLAPITQGAENIDYHIQVLNNDTGESRRASVGELLRSSQGYIDVTLPPYNCRFDGTITENAVATQGSNVIEFVEPIADRARVGHVLQIADAYGGGPGRTTITAVLDAYRVRVAQTPDTSVSDVQCIFGTDNTAGLQAALYEARARSTFTYGGSVLMPDGIGLTGALVYYPRTALYGRGVRQTMLARLDDGARAPAWYEYWQEYGNSGIPNEKHPNFVPTEPAPLLRAFDMYTDFPSMGRFSIHGARWTQTLAYPGFSMLSYVVGEPTGVRLPQVDPYPMFTEMHIVQAGWDGWVQCGHHSGSMYAVEIINCGGCGLNMSSYDANITNILAIGNSHPGMVFQPMAANNNLNSVKLSYNGVDGGWMYGDPGFCNLMMNGSGNNITAMRTQESMGGSIWVRGHGNQFTGTMIDDTGNISALGAAPTPANFPSVRAAIMLDQGATYNRFNDCQFGCAVYPNTNFATHALFVRQGAIENTGRIISKFIPKYDDGAYWPNGVTSGAYRPRAVSTDAAGGISPTNRLYLDDELISTYYP